MYLHNENGKHLGWFTWNNALDMSKSIDYAIYALAFSDKKPDNSVLPCHCKDTVYIGIAGGKYFDKKNRTALGGSIQTYLTKRFLDHNTNIKNYHNAKERKYKLFNEVHVPALNRMKSMYYSISVPPKDMDSSLVRSFISLCESEYIWTYAKKFDDVPLMNVAHREDTSRVVGSISHNIMTGRNLIDFIS